MLTASAAILVLGFLLLVGCVPEDTKPWNEGARRSEMALIYPPEHQGDSSR
jgi:hypothetical protein